MEILIAVFSGIAFLALIVYLWNSDSGSKDGSREPAKGSSPSTTPANHAEGTSLGSSAIEPERLAELEQKVDGLTRERAELLNDAEDYKQKDAAKRLELREAQTSAARSSHRVIELEAETSQLHRRLAELDNEQSSRQGEVASLHHELEKLTGFEQEAGILRQEKAELMEQVKKLEIENAAVARRLLALEDLEAKQPELEEKLANLSEQNGRLLGEITELQSSLRDKIKTQLDGLQELYKNLTPGLN
jgi:chromosome segregation ATPase